MATCTKCGKTNYDGVKYCTACGTPLSSASNSNYNDESSEVTEEKEIKAIPINNTDGGQPKKERKGVDSKLLYIILGVIFFGTLIFVVKYFFMGKSVAPVVEFAVSTEEIYVGEEVTFTDKTKDATSWDWNFGDNSTEEAVDALVKHIFLSAGPFDVKLVVNGKYTGTKKIYVSEKVLVVDTVPMIPIEIAGPEKLKLGEEATYTDNTPGATKWEWQMGETGKTDGLAKSITYKFKTPGVHFVSVYNDIAKRRESYKVQITPVAPIAKPGQKPAPKASNEVLKKKMQMIADGGKEGFKAIYYDFVKDDLCSDNSLKILENGKDIETGVKAYCQGFQFRKKFTILEVIPIRDPQTGCIIELNVKTK